MTNIELISLTSSIASLVLAIVAIKLALHHKSESDAVNAATKLLLLDVHSDAKALSAVAMPELKAYGETMRNFVFKEETGSRSKEFMSLLEEIRIDIDEIKGSNNLSEVVSQKISEIERTINERKRETEKQNFDKKGYLTIQVDGGGDKVVSTPIHQFKSVQDLLDMIWVSFLEDIVPPYTYGLRWRLIDITSGDKLNTRGKSDGRKLSEVNISEDSHLVVELT